MKPFNHYKKKTEEKQPMNVKRSSNNKQIRASSKYATPQVINLSQPQNVLSLKYSSDGHNTYTIIGNNPNNNGLYLVINTLSKKLTKVSEKTNNNTDNLDKLKPNIEDLNKLKPTVEDLNNLKPIVEANGKDVGEIKQAMNAKFEEIKPYMDIGNTIFARLPMYYENIDDTKSIRDNVNIDYTKCYYGYSKTYTETGKIHRLGIVRNISKIFVTLIGAGGAGGLGYISNNYYYSGGGGGSGAYARRIPVEVHDGYVVFIVVGKGGNLSERRDGDETYVQVLDRNGNPIRKISASGAGNGHPHTLDDTLVDGGNAAMDNGAYFRDGLPGNNGHVSLPSQANIVGGNGADSGYAKGGIGGGTQTNDEIQFIGGDGSFGSGGGGSSPKPNIDLNEKLSGNGGDGFVMIEFAD